MRGSLGELVLGIIKPREKIYKTNNDIVYNVIISECNYYASCSIKSRRKDYFIQEIQCTQFSLKFKYVHKEVILKEISPELYIQQAHESATHKCIVRISKTRRLKSQKKRKEEHFIYWEPK